MTSGTEDGAGGGAGDAGEAATGTLGTGGRPPVGDGRDRGGRRYGTAAEQRGWYWYDWANSAFVTTVITVFGGRYLTTLAREAADAAGFVQLFGIPIRAGS